jgi:hypothetical protein
MPSPNSRTLTADRHCALLLLAANPSGCSEHLLRAHGFTAKFIAGLVDAGLATTKTERMMAGRQAVEVTRVRITDAGRDALEGL